MAKKLPIEKKKEGRISGKLRSLAKNAKGWTTMKTPVPNVTIVRAPPGKTRPALLYLGFYPKDKDGKHIKKMPLLLYSPEQCELFIKCFRQKDVDRLFDEIKIVNDENMGKKEEWEIKEF